MLRLSRSRLRWLVVVTGVMLLAGLRLAPALPLSLVTPVSLVWLLLLALLLYAGYTVLSAWIGSRAALVIVVVVVLLPVAGTLVPASRSLDTRLPCPRNWRSPATWMLRPSPMGSTLLQEEGVSLRICYGRPAARGRTMLGGSRVPYGQLWRTGANEPTTLITTTGAMIAGVEVPPGRSALYTVPGPESWRSSSTLRLRSGESRPSTPRRFGQKSWAGPSFRASGATASSSDSPFPRIPGGWCWSGNGPGSGLP